MGIILILALVSGALSILLFQNINQLNIAHAEWDTLDDSLSALDSKLISVQLNLNQTEPELSNCENQLSTSEHALKASERSLQELSETSQERTEILDSQLSSSRDQLASIVKRVGELGEIEDNFNKMICDPDLIGLLKMDYSSIQSSSSRLQGFVANLEDSDHVRFAVRNTLWNDTDSKIHRIGYVSDDGNTYST